MYREMRPMAYAGYLIRLRVTKDNDPEFLSDVISTALTRKRMLRGMCKSIIGMANINATEIQAMRIPSATNSITARIHPKVAAAEKLKAAQRASLVTQDALFAALQADAFQGAL